VVTVTGGGSTLHLSVPVHSPRPIYSDVMTVCTVQVSLCCAFLVNIAVFHQRSYGVLLWTIF